MPYKLRKAPKRDLYWVVNKETGKKYSNEPLPKDKAKAQMRALYAAESKEGGAKQYLEKPVGSTRMSSQKFAELNQQVADFFAPMEKIKYAKEHPKTILLPAEKKARKAKLFELRVAGIDPSTVSDEAKGEKAETTPSDAEIPSLRGDNRQTEDATRYTKMSKEEERKVLGYGQPTVKALEGCGAKNLNMFELFKGTGSIGKVASKMGFNVVSLDFDPIYTPDIETDILKWDYKGWAEEHKFIPDYIWASPPCNTFSTLAYRLKERDTKTAEPKSARAKEGTAILHRTLEIIKYFQSKNPKMLYTVENPRGMMRHDKVIKKLPNRETTLYCLYGDFKRKPTDFWSNFPMELKPHTEKCKSKKVVANLADLPTIEQRYSIPGRLVKKILTRAKECYGDEPMMGAGFFGDIWGATKRVVSKVINRVKDVSRGIRMDYSPSVRAILAQVGDRPVVQAYVRRDPIVSLLNTALNFISRGKWNEARAKYNYDKLFHLGLEVVIKVDNESDVLARYVMEKNEVISISFAKAFTAKTEVMEVPLSAGITINSLLEGARKQMGDKFFPYDPFYNNCQDFIMGVLNGSGLATPGLTAFVKQPMEDIIDELPGYTGKIAKAITDLGGLANVAIEGRGKLCGCGGLKPHGKFANQLERAGVSPAQYLMEARRKAKKLGLAYKHLGFSDNDKQKLQIPNADGSLVRFGAVGLGDHILYTLAKDAKADEHRKHYLQRATKIRGDWAKDEYSPNSLAIGILW